MPPKYYLFPLKPCAGGRQLRKSPVAAHRPVSLAFRFPQASSTFGRAGLAIINGLLSMSVII